MKTAKCNTSQAVASAKQQARNAIFLSPFFSSPSTHERARVHCSWWSQLSCLAQSLSYFLKSMSFLKCRWWAEDLNDSVDTDMHTARTSQPFCSKAMATQGFNILTSPAVCEVTGHLEDMPNLLQKNPGTKDIMPPLTTFAGARPAAGQPSPCASLRHKAAQAGRT